MLYEELVGQRILPYDAFTGVASEVQTPQTLGTMSESSPCIDPDDSRSSLVDPILALRLKEIKLELSRQEHQNQLLQLQAIELQTNRQLKLRELELRANEWRPTPIPRESLADSSTVSTPVAVRVPRPIPAPRQVSSQDCSPVSLLSLDLCRQIQLVPQFTENNVDKYFPDFDCIATNLHWPKSEWSLLLQCKLIGKAHEVCSALSLEESPDYEVVEATVLRAYKLVPESYRQRFRKHAKTPNQTFVEFAHEQSVLFDKWCSASNIITFEQLKELMLLEEFKNCVPKKTVHLNERNVSSLSEAAVMADEFVSTHKGVFSPLGRDTTGASVQNSVEVNKPSAVLINTRECF